MPTLPVAPETYSAPVVRPYEPPSSFGRREEEGDTDTGPRRRIPAPVAVEAYRGSYENAPSDREISYERAVERASRNADEHMGPLDGRWTVTDAQGQEVLSLVLSDRGADKPVEGAWSRPGAADKAVAMGMVDNVTREGDGVVVSAAVDGRPASLRLHPSPEGWTGVMAVNGRDRPVTLSHPD